MTIDIEELKRLAEPLAAPSGADSNVSWWDTFHRAANPATVLGLIAEIEWLRESREELLDALHRTRSTPPALADGGGFVVDHFDHEGEYIGSQNIDPMWVVQEMAFVADTAIANAEKTK